MVMMTAHLSACATFGTTAPTSRTADPFAGDLPFIPSEYLADGVKAGSATERKLLRVNGRWCAKFTSGPCPTLETLQP